MSAPNAPQDDLLNRIREQWVARAAAAAKSELDAALSDLNSARVELAAALSKLSAVEAENLSMMEQLCNDKGWHARLAEAAKIPDERQRLDAFDLLGYLALGGEPNQ